MTSAIDAALKVFHRSHRTGASSVSLHHLSDRSGTSPTTDSHRRLPTTPSLLAIDFFRLATLSFTYLSADDIKAAAVLNRTMLLEILHAPENSLAHPRHTAQVQQDMSRPLAEYFISSSHNTYLVGKQWRDTSWVDAYARCLRMGCRCVELDLWDGPNGSPIITHGGAFCTTITLREVLLVIRTNAFVASDFPVILSLENHCSVHQQDVRLGFEREERTAAQRVYVLRSGCGGHDD